MKRFNNILIIRTDRIGDVVLTTPAIKSLRKSYPMAKISLLVVPSTKDLVFNNPYLDEVILDERQGRHKGWIGFLQLARDLRRRDFDAVFVFHTKRRYNFVTFLAGIPFRIGYNNNKWSFFLTHPLKDFRSLGQKHETEFCLDILKAVGIKDMDLDFFISTSKEAENWASQWLSLENINSGELIAIHPGSSNPAISWPVEKFAKLIDVFQQRYSLKVVLIGSADTVERCGQILQKTASKPLNLTGQTSLAQTVSLLRRCRLLISNDSGPVHIAAAVGIHVLSLFTRNIPGVNPERWRPLSDKGDYLYSPGGVEVEVVLERIEKMFRKDHQNIFHW